MPQGHCVGNNDDKLKAHHSRLIHFLNMRVGGGGNLAILMKFDETLVSDDLNV